MMRTAGVYVLKAGAMANAASDYRNGGAYMHIFKYGVKSVRGRPSILEED